MRKFNKVLVIVLAVVLLIMCAVPPTFSWFTRPQSKKGSSLKWDGIMYNANSDTSLVTMETKMSNWTGEIEDKQLNVESLDELYKKLYKYDFSTDWQTLGEKSARYYSTAITNSSTKDVTVSLYIPSISAVDWYNSSNAMPFHLGVNDPAKTHKLYGVSGLLNEKQSVSSTMRVYFQPRNNNNEADVNWKDKEYYIYYTASSIESDLSANSSKFQLEQINSSYTYYADIPSNATYIFFATHDYKGESYFRTGNFKVSDTKLSQTNSLVFYVTPNNYINGSDNIVCNYSDGITGANILKAYTNISLTPGSSLDARLENNEYIGSEITYELQGSGSGLTCNNGNLTASYSASGSYILVYKVKGSYGDTVILNCQVRVASEDQSGIFTDVPIVTNFVIPAGVPGEDGAIVPTTKYVYWYIENDGTYGSMLQYKINSIALTL